MFCNFGASVLISIVNYLLFYKFFMLFACFSVQRDIIVVEICYKNILFGSVISRSCSAVPACLLATVLNFNCMEASLSVYVSHWPLLALCLGAGKPTFRFDLHFCFIFQRCLAFELMFFYKLTGINLICTSGPSMIRSTVTLHLGCELEHDELPNDSIHICTCFSAIFVFCVIARLLV